MKLSNIYSGPVLGTRGCLIIKQLPIGLLFERVTPTVQSGRVLNIYLSN